MLCTAFLCLFFVCGHSQVALQTPTSAKISGIGSISSTLTDIHAALGNPAGLAFLKSNAALAAVERRYGLKELQLFSLAAASTLPGWGGLAISVEGVGHEDFKQWRLGLAYGRSLLAEKLSLGLRFWWLETQINEYGRQGTPSFDIGLMSHFSDKVRMAIFAVSPLRPKLGAQTLDGLLRWGLTYCPSSKVSIFTELEKDIHHPLNGKVGLEYCPIPVLTLRCGWSTQALNFNVGAGFVFWENWGLDLAVSHHQWLGMTPVCTLYFQQEKRK